MDSTNTMPLDRFAFREVVRHPEAHALVLGTYRVGEHAGVVALGRLLGQMEPGGKLHQAMTIHHRDEQRHSGVFHDWIERIGLVPPALPTDVDGFFYSDPEDYAKQRAVIAQLTPERQRIVAFAGIHAIERGAYDLFEVHLSCLERKEDLEALQSVMDEEKFHLSYVHRELEKQSRGEDAVFVERVMEHARTRFAAFQQRRRAETLRKIEAFLGGSA